MGIHANAGTQVGIGTTAEHADATAFAGETYTPIHNITDVGESGGESEILTTKHVDRPEAVRKLKGSRDNGTMTLVVDRDSSDAGYQALIAAEKTPHAYAFRVRLNDAPASGSAPKGSVFYFRAIVASAKNSFNDADNIVSTTFALAITGPILEVPASAS